MKVKAAVDLMFEAEPAVHPYVVDAMAKATAALDSCGIPYRIAGGMALNMIGIGRPTKDVDIVVPRMHWHTAIEAVRAHFDYPDGVRFGLVDEPDEGLAVVSNDGVCVEIWPAGTKHGKIAMIRGKYREHPAALIGLSMQSGLSDIINDKLASYLSAKDRMRDAADVQAIILRKGLGVDFAKSLHPAVRAAFRKIWKETMA